MLGFKEVIEMSTRKNAYRKPKDMTEEEMRECCEGYKREIRKSILSCAAFLGFSLLIICGIGRLPMELAMAFSLLAVISIPITLPIVHMKNASICCPVCGYATMLSRWGGILGLVYSKCPRCGFSLAKYNKR